MVVLRRKENSKKLYKIVTHAIDNTIVHVDSLARVIIGLTCLVNYKNFNSLQNFRTTMSLNIMFYEIRIIIMMTH